MVAVAVNSQDYSAKPQTVNDSAGVTKHSVLVAGTAADQVKNPAGANASKIIGVAGYDAADGEVVSVYTQGDMNCIASAAIAVGDYVNITGTTGKVKPATETAGTQQIVGIARSATTANNQYVKVQLQIGLH